MTRDSIVLYKNWGKLLRALPNEQAGELVKAICSYCFEDGDGKIEDTALEAIFVMIKDKLDEDYRAYLDKVERMKKNSSSKSERKETNRDDIDTISTRKETNRDDIEGDTVTDTDTDTVSISKDIDKGIGKRFAFRPPDVNEVRSYCQERKNKVDPEKFVNFYSAKGWYIGKNKMKDWRAAVRTWEKEETARSGTTTRRHNFEQSDYDLEAIERAIVKNG